MKARILGALYGDWTLAKKKTDKTVEAKGVDEAAPEFLIGAMMNVDADRVEAPSRPVSNSSTSRPSKPSGEQATKLPDASAGQARAAKPQLTGPKAQVASGSYTVLARRYRSREFAELIGQEPIAQTLKNAIATGRTAHAYLFCGTRGVGKTSMARIFAKAMNVTPDLTEGQAIGDAIMRGDDLDVIEIDGASNRGIDEVRNLIAGAGLSPSRCRYKIFIIDEVHMLTQPAFNALLKTMEEPPSHVKFILCTTEVSKVPETIRSRCQRFDFRPIPTARIAEQLRSILKQEGMEADDEAVAQMARLGHGSMRDALSIMDRLLAGEQRRLTIEIIADMLGLPEQALVTAVVEAIIAGDPAAVLTAGAQLLARGTSVEQSLESLIDHLRNLMIAASAGPESDLLELSSESREAVAAQAKHFDAAALVYMIALCEATARHARGTAAARAMFDATLVRLALAESLASIPTLLAGGSGISDPRGAGEKKKPDEARSALIQPAQSSGAQETELKPLIETLRTSAGLTTATTEAAKPRVAESSRAVGDFLDAGGLWQRVLAGGGSSPADQAKLAHLHPESFDGRTLRLTIGPDAGAMAGFLRTQTAWVAAAVRRATGLNIRVEFATPANQATASAQPHERIVEEALQLPLVKQVMELMDATIVEIVTTEAPPSSSSQEPDHV